MSGRQFGSSSASESGTTSRIMSIHPFTKERDISKISAIDLGSSPPRNLNPAVTTSSGKIRTPPDVECIEFDINRDVQV